MKNRKCFQLILALSIFLLPGVAQAQCVPVTSVACNWNGDKLIVYAASDNCDYPYYFSCNGSFLTGMTLGEPYCWPSTTPYLFSGIKGSYYIDNDVLDTTWNKYYEKSKEIYEHNAGEKTLFARPFDFYKLRLNPTIEKDGIHLLIEEIEPEESHFDQVRLLRMIYDEKADLIIDAETQEIHAVKRELVSSTTSCIYKGKDCSGILDRQDENYIVGEKDDDVSINFDMTKLKGKEIYLVFTSWGRDTVKLQNKPFEVNGMGTSLRFSLYDVKHPENTMKLKDVHPRGLESDVYINITAAAKELNADVLGLKILWTEKHALDFVSMMTTEEVPMKSEELLLVKAGHSRDGDVLREMQEKDFRYAHTVRGDKIELTFAPPNIVMKQGEKESYVFVSVGFFHGLRTYLYPEIDPTDSWKKGFTKYVEELRKVLGEGQKIPHFGYGVETRPVDRSEKK